MDNKKIRPQDIWSKKAGYISKSYKLKKELTDAFAIACCKNGISQARCLSIMMECYITGNFVMDSIAAEEKY